MAERQQNPITPVGTKDNRFCDPHIKIFRNPDTGRENLYMYVGHDASRERFVLEDWYVLFSEDLVHWQCKKSLSRRDTYLPDDSVDCWACDCVLSPWDGKYYLYYSNGGESTGVAVSDRPDGPFTDARDKTPILPKGITPTNSYDPDILLPDEDDPHAYILFGSDWTDHYWAMELKPSMTEVVPGSARKVPVYPADGTPVELTGELRSDQAEAFRYGDTWYLYWAGRYAVSRNRLGPYVFRGNIGKEIPHYPDGRCFIDHGSFLEWHGQWFYAVSHGTETPVYRQCWLMYVHMCDDGTLMLDETIRRCGVGQYCAGWDRIEAEWYMEKDVGLRKVEIREGAQHLGFAVAQQEGTNCLLYPHVYDLRENSVLCLCIKKERNAQVAVEMDGAEAGQLILDQPLPAYTCVSVPLRHSAGEHTLCLRLTGAISLDWFAFC